MNPWLARDLLNLSAAMSLSALPIRLPGDGSFLLPESAIDLTEGAHCRIEENRIKQCSVQPDERAEKHSTLAFAVSVGGE